MAGLQRIALTGAMAGAVAACAGGLINFSHVSDGYRPELLSYVAGTGGILTEVSGNPFEAPKAALERRVTESFEASHFGPDFPFFTEAPTGYRSPYRVVVLFSPAPHANGERLCSRPDRPRAPAAKGAVRVLASLCSSDSRISTAAGSLAGVNGPDDPAFGRLMRQVSLNLFPSRSPDRNDRDAFF
jgi:hypothetical protein